MNKIKRTKNHSFPHSVLLGFFINITTLLVAILLFALISSYSSNPLQVIKLGSVISFYICAVISSVIISIFRKENSVLISFVSALSISIILLCAGLIFSNGSFSLVSAMNYLIYCLISFTIAKLLKAFKKRRRKI